MAVYQIRSGSPAPPAGKQNVQWQTGPGTSPGATFDASAYLPDADASNTGAVKLARDLGNTAALPKVVGLQGVDLDPAAPNDGDLLQYDSAAAKWKPLPKALNKIIALAQAAAITPLNLLVGAAGTAGIYRVGFYHITSQAGSVSGASQLTLAWNDGIAAQTFLDTTLLNTLGDHQAGDVLIHVPASQNITYAVSYASVGGTPYLFDLYLTLEKIA